MNLHSCNQTFCLLADVDSSLVTNGTKCFTGAKKRFFAQKTLKKSVKMGELFINSMNCQQFVEHCIFCHTARCFEMNKVALSSRHSDQL